jgi:Domain of unknown function (DUF3576)
MNRLSRQRRVHTQRAVKKPQTTSSLADLAAHSARGAPSALLRERFFALRKFPSAMARGKVLSLRVASHMSFSFPHSFARSCLLAVSALCFGTLGGCSVLESVGLASEKSEKEAMTTTLRQNISAEAGMNLAARPAGTAAVNAYLWRAALDALSFMPMIQADPYGGVVLTDWYSPPATPGERFKVNLYILDAALRADGVRATVFRQTLQNGVWIDAAVAPETGIQLEDSVLTRARQLRQADNVDRK